MPKEVISTCISISPYSPSRPYEVLKLEKEDPDSYDQRTWRERANYFPDTREIYIPPMAFKMAVAEAARRLSLKIPGKRNATYTKNFLSGVLCLEPVGLGLKMEEAKEEKIYAHANGVRGSGSRVFRRYPRIDAWKAPVSFLLLDDEIPKDIFERCLREAGNLIGIGRFRPQNGGYFGRFEVQKLTWKD